ncbi:MAG: hypothetical protein ACREXY_18235 [Gammaproteobacteria bacterium]
MEARSIDAGEAIRHGWDATKANFNSLVVLVIVAGLLTGIPSWIAETLKEPSPGLSFLFRLMGFVMSMLLGIGALRVSLRLHDGQPVSLQDLFIADWPLFWRYILATLLYSLAVGVGLILFVIPGVVLGVRYVLYGYFVLERGARPVEALRQSATATEGVRWEIFLLMLLLLVLNVLGAALLLVGLLFTIPLTYLTGAWVYRRLTGGTVVQPGHASPDTLDRSHAV